MYKRKNTVGGWWWQRSSYEREQDPEVDHTPAQTCVNFQRVACFCQRDRVFNRDDNLDITLTGCSHGSIDTRTQNSGPVEGDLDALALSPLCNKLKNKMTYFSARKTNLRMTSTGPCTSTKSSLKCLLPAIVYAQYAYLPCCRRL